jgi:hypothetical protein
LPSVVSTTRDSVRMFRSAETTNDSSANNIFCNFSRNSCIWASSVPDMKTANFLAVCPLKGARTPRKLGSLLGDVLRDLVKRRAGYRAVKDLRSDVVREVTSNHRRHWKRHEKHAHHETTDHDCYPSGGRERIAKLFYRLPTKAYLSRGSCG